MVDIQQLRDRLAASKVREKFDDVVEKFQEDIMEEFRKCIQCGYCRNTSATYQMSNRESCSHPGRMFIIKNFSDNKEKIIESIYHLTVPGRAELVCPAGIKHEYAFIQLRKNFFNEAVELPQFKAMKQALSYLRDRNKENYFGKRKELKFNWLSEVEHRRSDYLYFVGSNDLLNNHEKVRRVLWLLNKFKIPYTISKHEPDSGYLAYLLGDSATADYYAEKVKNLVEDMTFKKIIVSCPFELNRLRMIFSGTKVEVLHIMELIANKLSVLGNKKVHKIKARTAYLDPYYLTKYYPYGMPREILRNIGSEIIEKVHSKAESFSSGAGDGFELIFPEDAERIAEMHLNEAQNIRADYLVTNDSYAEKLLSKTAKKVNSRTKVIDFIALIVKAVKWAL